VAIFFICCIAFDDSHLESIGPEDTTPVDFRVTVQALQMIALFPNISVKWPPYLTALFQANSIFVSIL
jgi:hypothetical protein